MRREEKTTEELYDDVEEGLSNTELYTMGALPGAGLGDSGGEAV